VALDHAIAEVEKKAPKVARLLEEHGEEILGALPRTSRANPGVLWRCLSSVNRE
jgi:hypothetical protein